MHKFGRKHRIKLHDVDVDRFNTSNDGKYGRLDSRVELNHWKRFGTLEWCGLLLCWADTTRLTLCPTAEVFHNTFVYSGKISMTSYNQHVIDWLIDRALICPRLCADKAINYSDLTVTRTQAITYLLTYTKEAKVQLTDGQSSEEGSAKTGHIKLFRSIHTAPRDVRDLLN